MERYTIQAVICDMDGTAAFRDTHDASYSTFFRHMGLEDQAQAITDRYNDNVRNMMTPDDHQRQFSEAVALLRGRRAPTPREIYPRIPYAPGFQEFQAYLRSQEVSTGIVTLSLLTAANLIREEMGMQLVYANEIDVQEGFFTGIGKLHVRFGSKGVMVQQAVAALGSTAERTAYIGDSLNDADPWKAVALPLGVNLHHPDCKQYVHASFTDFHGILDFLKKNVDLEGRIRERAV